MEDVCVSGTVAAQQFCDQIVNMFVSHKTRDVFYHSFGKPNFYLVKCICCGSNFSLVQILFSFVFGYGNV